MKLVGSYIQYGGGFNKDNVDRKDISNAIEYLRKTDDEHADFWIGVYGDKSEEKVLEINKWFETFLHLNDNKNTFYATKLNDFEQITNLCELFVNGKIEEVEKKMIGYKSKITQTD
ncbi:hypothetical protein [Psychroserpens sp. NJDZ02]|uniref:hypothetical protein n=1 Tax=Psychroserpens sp. NJDZ02 TaxID=2570561 RepID=UPI0010A895AD|nr:hypothetical protein [Psychroserpens sp. NJDZ02]QCE43044.1 hypothetical protein E9099_17005 [Psychroserpens sp. NJDZ02]